MGKSEFHRFGVSVGPNRFVVMYIPHWYSTNFIPKVSINNHSLWVYEVDGLYIKPTKVDVCFNLLNKHL